MTQSNSFQCLKETGVGVEVGAEGEVNWDKVNEKRQQNTKQGECKVPFRLLNTGFYTV